MKKTLFQLAVFTLCLAPISPLLAQEADDVEDDAEGGGGEPSELSPAPGKDLIKLKSGEVISGKIVRLTGEELTFQSDTLGEVKLPWAQVESIEAGNEHEFATPTGTLKGRVSGAPGALNLDLRDGEQVTIGAGELEGINPAPEKTEIDYWSGKLILGLSLTYGNSRQRTGTALASVQRDDGTTRVTVEGFSIYGEASGVENAKSHRGSGQFDYQLTERFYLTPFVGTIDYDKFQNIARRFRGGPGVGYEVLNADNYDWVTWNVEAGYAYTHVVLRRAPPGTRRTRSGHAVRAATRVTVEVNEHISLRGFYETYIGTSYVKDTSHHVEAGASFKYSFISFDIGLIFDRRERVDRGTNGKLPKKNDAKLIAGLGFSF